MSEIVCLLNCTRWKQVGRCIHITKEFQELITLKSTAREVLKEQRVMKRNEKSKLRNAEGIWEALPEWKTLQWAEWRKIGHRQGVYVIVDDKNRIMVVGDAVDLWKRIFSWEQLYGDFVPRDAAWIWFIKTALTKEMVLAVREVLGWERKKLRDPMRLRKWTKEIGEAALVKHPGKAFKELEDATEQVVTEPLGFYDVS